MSEVEKRAFRINEFARMYSIGRTKVYEEIKAGRLKAFKIGASTRISREAADSWQRLSEAGQAS